MSNNLRLVIVALIAAVIGGVVGVFGYIWIVGGDGTASAPITAPTLDVNAVPTANPTQIAEQLAALNAQITTLNEQSVAQQATISAQSTLLAAQPTTEPTSETTAEATTETAADAAVTEAAASVEAQAAAVESDRRLFRIDSTASTVTFALQEDLRGVRTDVIGTTSEVAGDIVIDFAQPSASVIGTIRVNARTLATDNEFRNRAIRSEILQSSRDEFEFIDFVPTAINGLPETITVGETYPVQIDGTLTILGQAVAVTFDATVTLASETQLIGSAQAVVNWGDWGIRIPNAPGVANITETVTLTINFTANQVES